jgi:hypothetical protein
LHVSFGRRDSFRFKNSSAKPTKPTKEKPRNLRNPDPETIIKPGQFSMEIPHHFSAEIDTMIKILGLAWIGAE